MPNMRSGDWLKWALVAVMAVLIVVIMLFADNESCDGDVLPVSAGKVMLYVCED